MDWVRCITLNPAASVISDAGRGSQLVRSLINMRAICPAAQEYVGEQENIRTLRMSLNIHGDGFVEAVAADDITAIASQQANSSGGRIHREWIEVPVLEG